MRCGRISVRITEPVIAPRHNTWKWLLFCGFILMLIAGIAVGAVFYFRKTQ